MNLTSVEDAYEKLAQYVLVFVDDRRWDEAGCSMRILSKMARGSQWLVSHGIVEKRGGFEKNMGALWDGLDAAIFLRDDLLATTGDRIWGLTFTLYPDGKFKIEYDYNKPEGYEETDETITFGEASGGLPITGNRQE